MQNTSYISGDDIEQLVAVDNVLLEQIDERLGNTTFRTRKAFVQSAVQQYIQSFDLSASKQQSVPLPAVKPSLS
jgi:metal-responsive CopG/Arc/MetJ family transcriptional regulator